jgi:hypothetical protein
LTIILAAAATCVSVYSRARTELDSALIRHEAAGVKVEDLTIRVQKLERDVKQLRTDSRVIELFARQRFGFVRSGDVVIKVSQDLGDATGATSGAATGPPAVVTGAASVASPRADVDVTGPSVATSPRSTMGGPQTAQGVAISTTRMASPGAGVVRSSRTTQGAAMSTARSSDADAAAYR